LEKVNPDFIKEYGKSWKNYIDNTFLIILTFTLSFTLIFIIIIANHDYSESQRNLSEIITREYIKTLFSDIKIESPATIIDTTQLYSNLNINGSPKSFSEENNNQDSQGDLDGTENITDYGLDLGDINLPEALVAVKNKNKAGIYVRPIQPSKRKTVDIRESRDFNPWTDPIKRQGEIQIEPIKEIIRGSQIVRGWRNPDEITFAIQKKEQMIEYCFKREAKFFNDLHGYVIVRFIILHSGFVDPASVQIIKSTLFNKQIESCIKKRLQLWRGFEQLDVTMGSVAVVQKFIFD
jgi:hypothetical protein